MKKLYPLFKSITLLTFLFGIASSGLQAQILQYVETVTDGQGVQELGGAKKLVISPDGSHLYALGANDDAVIAFERDAVTGTLTHIASYVDNTNGINGLANPFELTISPDGSYVYVMGGTDDSLAVFSRDMATGMLTFQETYSDDFLSQITAGFGNPEIDMAINGEGTLLAVSSVKQDFILVYNRNVSDGSLTFLQQFRDNTAGVDGLDEVYKIEFSPDGNFLYACSFRSTENKIAVFQWNPLGDTLVFNQAHEVNSPYSIDVSSNGRHLYAATSSAVGAYQRDMSTGALTFLKQETNAGGIVGFNFTRVVEVTNDGNFVFVATTSNTLIMLRRDTLAGTLNYVGIVQEGSGIEGLSFVTDIAVSPDDRHLYVAAFFDNAISAFSIGDYDFTPPPAPTNVNVTEFTQSDISAFVDWTPVVAPDFQDHRVYRNTINDLSSAARINILEGFGIQDTDALTHTWSYYWVTAVDTSGNESEAVMDSIYIIPSGLEEITSESLQLFPNPAVHEVTLNLPDLGSGTVALNVFNERGQHVKSMGLLEANQLNSGHRISLEDLPTGAYVIVLQHEDKVWMKKLIKQQ